MSENKFVSKFTVTEAVAVKQIKDALPDILTEAFGTPDVYTLWGVPLDKTSEDERIKVILVKFLRARYDIIASMYIQLLNYLYSNKKLGDTCRKGNVDCHVEVEKRVFCRHFT